MGSIQKNSTAIMKIYLVRHGEAEPGFNDKQRPLTQQGLAQVTSLAKHLAALSLSVDVIYHSGYVRAQQTAEILSHHVVHQVFDIHPKLAPEDDVNIIAHELEAMQKDIMVVGHLPFMGKLINALILPQTHYEIIKFMPATLVCLENNQGCWIINWILTPDALS